MNIHVQQEGYCDIVAQCLSFQSGEHQERQPGEQRDLENPPPQQLQCTTREMRPTEELKKGPPQDQREVSRFVDTVDRLFHRH